MSDSQRTGDSEGGREGPAPIFRNHLSVSQRITFELLSHSYRRYVLHFLATHSNGVATRRELATVVSESVHDEGDSTEDELDRIATELHHVHLPKLADANVLDYDSRTGYVRYWGEPTIEEFTTRAVAVGEAALSSPD